MMENIKSFFENIYQNFNEKKIDLIINKMMDDVQWANGMDGGYVWSSWCARILDAAFSLVSSNVTPLEIFKENDVIKIKVKQVVHDVNGNLLSDDIVCHYFTLKDGKVARLDIDYS